MRDEGQALFGFFLAIVPAVTDITDQRHGKSSEVYNGTIESLCWLFSQLLGSFGTNGALCTELLTDQGQYKEETGEYEKLSVHVRLKNNKFQWIWLTDLARSE